ncbi:hypothetical protein [Pseudoalteromonas piratica]|uniref:Uncharacterized protein n=1 Tax=Pseudoalteromonas piratica TaxID=1348114 RepID=A0A0A7EBQ7_9GAMM|nr:hypothetical protein [Pseudoalteromonas piratica]AIY63938.1 hypothetical protein OM33_01280 [Pseudoalteromonas piratica]
MDTILTNLNDPSWWFTGLFFVVIALLIPKAITFMHSIPLHAKGFKRKSKLADLKKVKGIRHDDTKVLIESIKTFAWMVVFILSILILMYSYLTEPIWLGNTLNNTPTEKGLGVALIALSLPIYVLEIIYLKQDRLLKVLIKHRDKLRITSKSTRT